MIHIIKYTKPNCAPCNNVEPFLRRFERKGAQIERIDIEDPKNAGCLAGRTIQSVPTIVVYKDGVLLDELHGFSQRVADRLTEYLDYI